MKRKLLKPLLGCLLAAALLACAKTEEVAAQGKQKGKTVKEMLCREWRISRFIDEDYKDNTQYGITFYPDYSFIFNTDPKWELGKNPKQIKGTWALFNKEDEKSSCEAINNYACFCPIAIKLETISLTGNITYSSLHKFFNNTNYNNFKGLEVLQLDNKELILGITYSGSLAPHFIIFNNNNLIK